MQGNPEQSGGLTTRPKLLVLGGTGRLAAMLRRWDTGAFQITWGVRQGHDPAPDRVVLDARTDPLALAEACARADVILDLSGPSTNPARDYPGFGAIPALARAVGHAAAGKPLFWMSSGAVYGPCRRAREDAPLSPVTAYGLAKIRGEAELAGRSGLCCLRLGNVAGADALLGAARPGVPVELDVFADGRSPLRAYIGPKTLVESLFLLLGQACAGKGMPPVLNLAAPGPGVEMAALLEAANLRWRARKAPDDAVAEVTLDTKVLSAHVPLDASAGTVEALVREWRADALRQKTGRP